VCLLGFYRRPRGFAFIEFLDRTEATAAIDGMVSAVVNVLPCFFFYFSFLIKTLNLNLNRTKKKLMVERSLSCSPRTGAKIHVKCADETGRIIVMLF
jgi:RNA recognition motif-containing protein